MGAAAQDALGEILGWLGGTADPEPAIELSALARNLDLLDGARPGLLQLDRIVEDLGKRAGSSAAVLADRLTAPAGGSGVADRRLVLDLAALYGRIASICRKILEERDTAGAGSERPSLATVARRALGCLYQQYRLSLLAGASEPQGMWRDAHRWVREARRELGPAEGGLPQSLELDRTYREMLALAAVQPSGLSSRELAAAADYVARFAATVEVTANAPAEVDFRLFWLDPGLDMAPIALARRRPPERRAVLYVSCARLGLLAAEQVRELEAGTAPEHLHLPPEASDAAYRGMLQRLHDAWVEPPSRQLVRRRNRYPVEVCIGFDAVRRLHAGGRDAAQASPPQSAWNVINESPTGFALIHEGGDPAGVLAGGVIALRKAADRPWDVCVVRWLRKDEAGRIEAGVQAVGSRGRAVRIAFRGAREAVAPIDGLLFPPASAVRAHEAILVSAGACVSRRFTLVTEEERTHVIQGRMVNLDLQTGLVELFEFQPDPYPI